MKLLDHKKITLGHMIYQQKRIRKNLNGNCDTSMWGHYDRYVVAIDKLTKEIQERDSNHE